jgi:Fe-S-cluster containining protein
MKKDLKIIAELAEENWADNWNFRSFLQHEVDPLIIDQTVHDLNRIVSAEIDCTTCANCCRELQPHLEEKDVTSVAAALDLSAKDTKKKYLVKDPDRSYRFSDKPCPLLNGTKCSIYKSRPSDCSEYPHLNKPDFLGGSIGVIENYRVCPIVFNVYEELKTKFHYDKNVDYIGEDDPEVFSGSYWEKI